MPSAYQHIRVRIEDRVGRITFARPPLNVFNIEMMREIASAVTQCNQRDLVAIVFDADKECRSFSAGVAVEEHVQDTISKCSTRSIRSFGSWSKSANRR